MGMRLELESDEGRRCIRLDTRRSVSTPSAHVFWEGGERELRTYCCGCAAEGGAPGTDGALRNNSATSGPNNDVYFMVAICGELAPNGTRYYMAKSNLNDSTST